MKALDPSCDEWATPWSGVEKGSKARVPGNVLYPDRANEETAVCSKQKKQILNYVVMR